MYKTIPDYPQYETDGKSVRSKATNKSVVLKKGTGKYYLLNKQGLRKLVAPHVIFGELFDKPIYEVGQKVKFNGWSGIITRFTNRGDKSYMKVKCDDGFHFKRIH